MNNEFAFPSDELNGDGSMYQQFHGMTLRDYFAARAPEISQQRMDIELRSDANKNPFNESHKPNIRSQLEILSQFNYEYADAMMKTRIQK